VIGCVYLEYRVDEYVPIARKKPQRNVQRTTNSLPFQYKKYMGHTKTNTLVDITGIL